MKTSTLCALALGAALSTATTAAFAQNTPRVPPAVLQQQAQQQAQQNDVLTWFDRLPPQFFVAFGTADRAQLLQLPGVIYDQNSRFIEIPMPAEAQNADLDRLQVKLYRANKGLVVAVNQMNRAGSTVPGQLVLYGVTANGQLLDVTKALMPDPLQTIKEDDKIVGYENAILPRAGTTIVVGVPGADAPSAQYLWNGTLFARRDAAPAKAATDDN